MMTIGRACGEACEMVERELRSLATSNSRFRSVQAFFSELGSGPRKGERAVSVDVDPHGDPSDAHVRAGSLFDAIQVLRSGKDGA